MISAQNIQIKDYYYELPQHRIASHPLEKRDECKLLVYKNQHISQTIFKNISDVINKDTFLVVNDTKVISARMEFFASSGARIEIFCLEPHTPSEYDSNFSSVGQCVWKCLTGNLKHRANIELKKTIIVNGKEVGFSAEILSKSGGEAVVKFLWNSDCSFADIISVAGSIPIPPYLKRDAEQRDSVDYQTVYSMFNGSVAAPTAGLHFTDELLNSLPVTLGRLTLHVGAGTFKPVKTQTVGEHEMHREFFSVSRDFLQNLILHLGNVTAVGTTSVRTLESLYRFGVLFSQNKFIDNLPQWLSYEIDNSLSAKDALEALIQYLDKNNLSCFRASTGIMVCPGFEYKIVNAMITNFHQPESTLLLLVSAAVGNAWRDIYDYALNNDFRFLSYGDGSYLEVVNNQTVNP